MDAPDQAQIVVSGLTPLVHATSKSQLANATPCEQWAVRDLLNHLVGGGHMFATCLSGGSVDPASAPGDLLGEDPAEAFDMAIAAFSASLAVNSDLSTMVTLPFGSMPAEVALRIASADLLVHSWDLARATGQRFDPPDELVASTEPFFQQFLQPGLREMGLFAAAVEPPAGATGIERLVAFAGRQP